MAAIAAPMGTRRRTPASDVIRRFEGGSSCRCRGTRLELGGWMGPTRLAPYPRACSKCSPDLNPREIQVRYHELVAANYPGMPLLEDLFCPGRPQQIGEEATDPGHVYGGMGPTAACVHCGHIPTSNQLPAEWPDTWRSL